MAKVKLSAFDRLRLGARLNRKDPRDVEQRLSAADPGLEIVNRDAAGIDVGNESHYVAVPRGRDAQPVREFGSWTAALVEMAQWLVRCGIRTVVMQSTGVYWIAVHDVLQKHGLEVNLVDARERRMYRDERVMCRNVSGSCDCIPMVCCEPVFCLLLRSTVYEPCGGCGISTSKTPDDVSSTCKSP